MGHNSANNMGKMKYPFLSSPLLCVEWEEIYQLFCRGLPWKMVPLPTSGPTRCSRQRHNFTRPSHAAMKPKWKPVNDMPQKSSKAVKIIPSILFAVNFINSLQDRNISIELALEQLAPVGHVRTLASVEEGEPLEGWGQHLTWAPSPPGCNLSSPTIQHSWIPGVNFLSYTHPWNNQCGLPEIHFLPVYFFLFFMAQ